MPETTPSSRAARPRLVEAEPEVHEDGAAVRREDDVRRLDVAVDDEPGVGVGQGVGHGRRDPGRLRPGRAVIPQPPAEVGAVEEIRDDVDLSPVQADVMDRHDAGVAQLGEPARLLEELLRLGLRHFGAASEDLDGHGPVELRVVAEVHRAEAAGPQGVPHLVAAEGGAEGPGRPSSSPARPADPASGPWSDPTRSPAPARAERPGLEAPNPTARRHRPRARLGRAYPLGATPFPPRVPDGSLCRSRELTDERLRATSRLATRLHRIGGAERPESPILPGAAFKRESTQFCLRRRRRLSESLNLCSAAGSDRAVADQK